MRKKQIQNYNKMLIVLWNIANGYLESDKLRESSNGLSDVDFDESIGMAYDNMQDEAKNAIKGVMPINF